MKAGLQRRLATGTNALLVSLMVVVIVVLLVDQAARHRMRFDLTSEGEATLQPDTLATLALADSQDELVFVTAFTSQRAGAESYFRDRTMRDFLRELEYRSQNVVTALVDFDRDRVTAEEKGVRRYGTVVVEYGDDRVDLAERDIFRRRGKGADKHTEFLGEAAISRAVSQVLASERRTVYVLTGHGERDIEDDAPAGLRSAVSTWERQGWDIETLDLLRDAEEGQLPSVPEDADALLLIRPRVALAPQEEEALRAYVGRGGRLGVFVDPDSTVPDLTEQVGVLVLDGVVLDQKLIGLRMDRPRLAYGSHAITEEVREQDLLTFVAHAAPLEAQQQTGLSAETLLRSSRTGWGERGTERPAMMNPGEDLEGPLTVGVALSLSPKHALVDGGKSARVAVYGDSDWLANDQYDEGPGNATLAVSTVRWLIGDEGKSSAVGRPNSVRRLTLSAGDLSMIRWLVLLALPLLVVLAGAVVWSTRRGR